MKRTKLLIYSLITIAAALKSFGADQADKARKPNLLFIMTDQQRYDAIGAVGKYKFLKTPNLDRLAKTGAFFTKAYTPCAVSGPARSCILTGLMVEHNNVRSNGTTAEDPVKNNVTTKKTFDQILAANGYYSEYHGKWHAPIGWTDCYSEFRYQSPKGNPFKYTTEHLIKYKAKVKDYVKSQPRPENALLDTTMFGAYYKPDPIDRRAVYGCDENGNLPAKELKKRKIVQPDNHGELILPAELSLTAFQATETIAALDRAKKSGKPFNITCSIFFPHAPMLPTKPFHGMYKPEDMPVPESIADPMVDSPYKRENGRNSTPEYSDPEKIKYMMANYFALVSEADMWIGKILGKLDEIGETDNTLIVFISDHGEMLGAHGMREKNMFLEESARVPMILNFPGKIKPTKIDEKTSLLDLFPTILDYMGVKYDKRDGESLVDVISGKKTKSDMVVTEWLYRNPALQVSHMIAEGDWKLMLSCDPESKVPSALYNLKDDPNEMKNLIGHSNPARDKYIAKAESLKKSLIAYLKEKNSAYADSISKVNF